MKLSWSHRLFLYVNRWAGTSRVYDVFVRFWAEYALFLLAAAVIGYLLWRKPHLATMILMFVRLPLVWAVGMGISRLVGWVYPHRRPVIEFPKTHQIIAPLSN